MAELVREGKVKSLGLCEVDAETLRRAQFTLSDKEERILAGLTAVALFAATRVARKGGI